MYYNHFFMNETSRLSHLIPFQIRSNHHIQFYDVKENNVIIFKLDYKLAGNYK